MNKKLAIFLVLLSAVLFGSVPLLIRLTFNTGNNGTTAAFLRSLMAIPILLIIHLFLKIPIFPKNISWFILFAWMGLNAAITGVALTVSYEYIPTGIATALHFIYPAMVAVFGKAIYKQKIDKEKKVSLLICLIGVFLFFEKTHSTNVFGIVLALISGCSYALYILGLTHPKVTKINSFTLILYMVLSEAVVSGIYGLLTNQLVFNMPFSSWLNMLFCALLYMVVGKYLFAIGTKNTSSLTGAIASTLEPITSVLCGLIFLNEPVSLLSIMGCFSILTSIIILTSSNGKSKSITA